jgi:hypothetical protein
MKELERKVLALGADKLVRRREVYTERRVRNR